MTRLVVWVFLLLAVVWPGAAPAATCNSIDPGNWSFTGNWSCNKVPDSGDDVTISHAISLNNADREARNFTIAAGGTLSDTGNTLTVTGAVVINGTWSGAGGGRLTKNGTGNLSGTGSLTGDTRIDINGNTSILGTSNLTFTDVTNGRIDIGGGVTVTNNGTVTVARLSEDTNTSTWTNAANSTLNIHGSLLNGSGVPADAGVLNASASGNTVNYLGTGDQDVKLPSGGDYRHLSLSGGGTKTLASSSTYDILGNLSIATGVTYNGDTNDPPVNIAGNFSNNGTFISGSGQVMFNGSTAQTFTGTANGTTTISTFRLNNASGLSLTGTHNLTVTGATLQSGRLKTNANVLYISSGAAIGSASATRFVVGNLRKRVLLGANVNRVFEVGSEDGGVRYTPVTSARFGSVSVAGDLTVSTTVAPGTGHHPQIGSSTLNPNKSVNRYWTFTKDGSLTFAAHANNRFIFNFINPGDLDPMVTTSAFFVGRYSPPLPAPPALSWTEITPSGTGVTTTTITGIGISSANVTGDYQIAEKPTAPPTPGSFDVFETSQADNATPKVIRTKVASGTTGFTLSVMAIQAGAKQTTFTGAGADVKLELLGNAGTGVAIDANNCPVSSTVLQTIASFGITGGRSNASFGAVPNSWRDVRVRVTYPTTSPTVTSCSTDNFAIRPASFTAAVTDADWSTPGTARALDNTGASGGRVHKAGRHFTITLTPSPATTTNYSDRTIAVGALTCVLAGTCTTGMLNVGTFTGNGTQVSSTATFSEVGAFNLSLQDQDYASVDASDGTPADCSGRYVCDSGAPRGVGRFVPDHFVVTEVAAPTLRTFDTTDASCSVPPSGARRSFTYIGQYFGYQTPPSAMVIAQNAQDQTTANYRGTLWKLTNASATQQFDNSPAKTLDITQIGTPVVAETPNTGTGTLTPSAAGKLAFQRDNATPQGEFTANLALTLSVSDASEAGAGQGTILTTTPLVMNEKGAGIPFDGGGATSGKTFYYGRLQMSTVRGEQGATLQVPLETQYWNGTTFARNTADHCTTLVPANFGLGNYAGNLDSAKATHSITGAFLSGQKTLAVSVPGSGSVEVVANLGAAMDTCTTFKPVPGTTGANQSWLRERGTCSTTYSKDPTGRATFGVRLGSEEMIHLRENF